MQVTPVGKKFGTYKPGDVFSLPDRAAQHLVKVGLLAAVSDAPKAKRKYMRRDMRAEA